MQEEQEQRRIQSLAASKRNGEGGGDDEPDPFANFGSFGDFGSSDVAPIVSQQIGQGLAAAVTTQVQKMMRPNGMLDRQYQRR